MHTLKICLLVLFVFGCRPLFGQSDSPFKNEVKVSVGFGLSSAGVHTFRNYELKDQNGFRSDFQFLISNPAVKEAVNLSHDQKNRIQSYILETNKKLDTLAAQALVHDVAKSKIEEIFLNSQDELLGMLRPDQLSQLRNAKAQLRISHLGFDEYVSALADHRGVQVSSGTLKALRNSNPFDLDDEFIQSLFEKANTDLLNELAEPQQKKLESIFSDDKMDRFLKQPLFGDQKPTRHSPNFLSKILRSKRLRKKLQLTEAQEKQLNAASRANSEAGPLKSILDKKQLAILKGPVVVREAIRCGTTTTLVRGELGRQLEVTPEQGRKLENLAVDLNAEVREKIRGKLAQRLKTLTRELPGEIRQAVRERIGAPIQLKSP